MSATVIPAGFLHWADHTFGKDIDAVEHGAKKLLEEIAEYREATSKGRAIELWHSQSESAQADATAIGDELADLYMTTYHMLDIIQRLAKEQGVKIDPFVESKFIANLKRKFEQNADGIFKGK